MKILVTGAAGFIGFHLCKAICEKDVNVKLIGIDNINSYYSQKLKHDRLEILKSHKNFQFQKVDLSDEIEINNLFETNRFDVVINLAAQAGVRYSLENPHEYISSNIVGFLNILEGCKMTDVSHLIYASSSSVYGLNTIMPFKESHCVDHPISLYAASKKSNELMAHCYSNLFSIPTTGLRFFTVYGPWGRPDMACFLFTDAIMKNEPIKIFNHGEMKRDFTYIDDIIEGIVRLIGKPPTINKSWSSNTPDPSSSSAPYEIFNIGNSNPVNLLDFIEEIEKNLGIKANKEYLPLQQGDVPETFASVSNLFNKVGYSPQINYKEGVKNFVDWYKCYYKL